MAEGESQHHMKEAKWKPWSFFRRAQRNPPAPLFPLPDPQASYGQISHRPRGFSQRDPSSWVEPPLVSVFEFAGSLFSMSGQYNGNDAPTSNQHPTQSEWASLPISNPAEVGSLPLETIHEIQNVSTQETSPKAASTAPSRRNKPSPSVPKSGSSNFSTFGPSTRATIVPEMVVMKLDASSIGSSQAPKPPDEAESHALDGGAYLPVQIPKQATESTDEKKITPTVSKGEPSPRLALDPAIFQQIQITPTKKQETNESSYHITGALPSGNAGSLVPPVSNIPMSSPNVSRYLDDQWTEHPRSESKDEQEGVEPPPITANDAGFYDISKPTCSLNLVCYRSGANGCDLQQVQCILRSKFNSDDDFQSAIAANPHLIHTDVQFFDEIQRLFATEMSGFFRSYFSLKSLQAFRVLAYTPTTRPVVVPLDDFVLQEMMYAYRNPSKLKSKDEWVKWVFRLRRKDKRHAIEFVEGWNTTRIAIAGTIPWLSSCLVGIIWAVIGGDIQTAFTVASFILTSSSIILALLAIISSIESAGRAIT
ncbi:hypothetical protein BKA56DRAFT_660140 [Ilyonectria sp. MPI-CAGE-AT-0026]|nr:hypothetical protein BKA56DRAFT_660140 [Ilyonectria sp. MPI-CAGE-AT-0026]